MNRNKQIIPELVFCVLVYIIFKVSEKKILLVSINWFATHTKLQSDRAFASINRFIAFIYFTFRTFVVREMKNNTHAIRLEL